MSNPISDRFPRYSAYGPAVPVWCVTPHTSRTIHRFFDTSPFSPSGRYLGLTRLPFEDRLPQPGDVAEIVLVDLEAAETRVIAETRGWDTQLGAQVQWGTVDTELYYNDVETETWVPFGVKVDPFTGRRRKLDGSVYMISPDGRFAASSCLRRTGTTQAGYGVIVPAEAVPVNRGVAAADGVWITDTRTGRSHMFISLQQVITTATPAFDMDEYAAGDFYGFHVKWNAGGDRIMFVLRWRPHDPSRKLKHDLITMNSDGSDVRVPIPESLWGRGGHHPNWCPDGQHIMMNLKLDGESLRFVRARFDGSGLGTLSDRILGSGHPTMHPDRRHILTDKYVYEATEYGDGTTPIRWVDRSTDSEEVLVRVHSQPSFAGGKGELRVDPHPAWDRQFSRIAFNGFDTCRSTRAVYVADLSGKLT
jgi:hypothetical protein